MYVCMCDFANVCVIVAYYRAMLCISAAYGVMWCLSVCPSHLCLVSKQLDTAIVVTFVVLLDIAFVSVHSTRLASLDLTGIRNCE